VLVWVSWVSGIKVMVHCLKCYKYLEETNKCKIARSYHFPMADIWWWKQQKPELNSSCVWKLFIMQIQRQNGVSVFCNIIA
jgi:hypothetical protein